MMKGMDVDAGKTAATQITAGAQELDGLTTKMTQVIDGFEWIGPDADRTRDQWKSDYVERYFQPYRGRLNDLESVYTSILAGHPSSGENPLFTQGDRNYGPNRGLDTDHDGVITAAEATAHVRSRMGAGSN